MGIFLPVKENYWGRENSVKHIFSKDYNEEPQLLVCALLFNETFQSLCDQS